MKATKLTYTDEQFAYLAQYESHFDCVIHKHYNPRPLPSAAFKTIRDIYHEATGSQLGGNPSCAQCVARVLRAAGGRWYDDKELRDAMAAEAAAKKAAQKPKSAPRKRKVSTDDKPTAKTRKTVKTAKKGE